MIIHGDCLKILKRIPDNFIHSVVTDPPYGLSFMNKHWDYDVPSIEIWKEVLRVLRPGGHLLSFGGTRTYHRMVVNIEDAGFEIRDQIQWLYGSGFPKSHNGDHGGTALKPANEPIVMARKPLIGTVAQNFAKFGTGGLNIDESRIGYQTKADFEKAKGGDSASCSGGEFLSAKGAMKQSDKISPNGRWPANVIFDEEAAKVLDEQSGTRKAGGSINAPASSTRFKNTHSQKGGQPEWAGYQDSGGASRFFYVAKASKRERNAGLEGMPTKKTGMSGGAQAQGEGYDSAQSIGLNRVTEKQNHHPTVKPIKLMEYLIKLVTPQEGIVLDPFCGSGSTLVAAKRNGFGFMGIEREAEYVEIAKRRVKATI